MVYLDYSATTPVRKEVLESFSKIAMDFIGNPNSLHKLGVEAKKLEEASTKQIASYLHCKPNEIIYTSGASESNNMAIKGIASMYANRGKKMITTNLEHSSIYGPLGYLQKQGFEVSFVKTNASGIVDLEDLKRLLTEDTILVTIAAVNSETGLLQPIDEIGKLIQQYPKCFFHVDLTQSMGKVDVDLTYVDLASFSAHKFYGIKGIGCLLKKEYVQLEPLIHGGKSTTPFRSGTPALPLIGSTAKALRMSLEHQEEAIAWVRKWNQYLCNHLSQYPNVTINHNENCIPYILNISVLHSKPETFLHALEEHDIYISTQSACSQSGKMSRAVYELTKDEKIASHSLRISLSLFTTEEEIQAFLDAFDVCYHNLEIR